MEKAPYCQPPNVAERTSQDALGAEKPSAIWGGVSAAEGQQVILSSLSVGSRAEWGSFPPRSLTIHAKIDCLVPTPDAPLSSHWEGLTKDQWLWEEARSAIAYWRGSLSPLLASLVYHSRPEVLVDVCSHSEVLVSLLP